MNKRFLFVAFFLLITSHCLLFFVNKRTEKIPTDKQIVNYFQKNINLKIKNIKKEGVKHSDFFFIFNNDSLISWNKGLAVNNNLLSTLRNKAFTKIGNKLFIIVNNKISPKEEYALIKIGERYNSNNKHLKNSFEKSFNKYPNVIIKNVNNIKDSNIVFDENKTPLFTIDCSNLKPQYTNSFFYLFFIQFIFLWLVSYGLTNNVNTKCGRWGCHNFFFIVIILALSRLMWQYEMNLDFLTNYMNLKSNIDISIFTDFIFNSIFFSFSIFCLASLSKDFCECKNLRKSFFAILCIAFIAFAFNFTAKSIEDIINNSDFIFNFSSSLDFSILNITVFFSLALLIFASVIGFVSCIKIFCFYKQKNASYLSSAIIILMLLIASFAITTFIKSVSKKKIFKIEQTNIFIKLLSADNSKPLFFTKNDKNILFNNLDKLSDFISKYKEEDLINANNDFYSNTTSEEIIDFCNNDLSHSYDVNLTICNVDDNIAIDGARNESKCFEFFDKLSERESLLSYKEFQIFTDNLLINYILGSFKFGDYRIYIELFPKLRAEGSGYPELLSSNMSNLSSKFFSWAVYKKNNLIVSSGKYLFPSRINKNATNLKVNGYNIIDGKKDDYSYFVVAKNSILPNKLTNISYLFLMLMFLFACKYLYDVSRNKKHKSYSLNVSIRKNIVISLLLLFLLVESSIVIFTISNYKGRQNERISSILKTLTARLESQALNLNELSNISDIMHSDINIFNYKGRLVATSRPQIFESQIANNLIDHALLKRIRKNDAKVVLRNESIADMKYLSAYVNIYNEDLNSNLILNIPYFDERKNLRNDIVDIIITGLDLYLLISLIAVILAYFLAQKIIKPLNNINEHIKRMEIMKRLEPIIYDKNDELGILVKEFNNMLVKIEEDAIKLSESERESAWREMAKQIAHEIKNPLTPMKLKIQHLFLTRDFEADRWQDNFEKTCNLLLEQIDQLSLIANSFSNFANINRGEREDVDLIVLLNYIKSLYSGSDIDININTDLDSAFVSCSKKNIQQAFINIIKNGIEAMRMKDNKIININLRYYNSYIIISFQDFGNGIDDKVKEHVFEPHFTTKTSGTGLGLAITKSIINNHRGSISFISKENQGTTFYVKIPSLD